MGTLLDRLKNIADGGGFEISIPLGGDGGDKPTIKPTLDIMNVEPEEGEVPGLAPPEADKEGAPT
jgi:hypothetical protein